MSSPSAADYLLLGRSLPARSIRLDVVLDRDAAATWAVRAVGVLRSMPGVDLRRVLLVRSEAAGRSRTSGPLFAAFHRLSVRRCPLFQPAAPRALNDLGLEPVHCGPGWQAELESDPPDVLLNLTGGLPAESCARLARRHVWSLVLGDPEQGYSTVPYFRETAGNSTTLALCLVEHSTGWHRGRILYRLQSGKFQSLFYLRAAEDAVRHIGPIVARRLHDLLLNDTAGSLPAKPQKEIVITPGMPPPSTWELARYVSGRIRHSLMSRTVQRSRGKRWFIAWRDRPSAFTANRESFTPEGFHDFAGRPDLGYADPFPVEWEGRQLLFIEEILPDERGRLVVTEIAGGREPDTPPAIILDKPYHLSYPFVFEHQRQFYLIPETCQNRSVELYRAVHFPEQWELHKVLVKGLRLADTTPFFHGGLWYFFVTALDRGLVAPEAHLFYSDRVDGEWTAHPANPISSDARRLRSAGRLFWRRGQLIRPVQDCSLDYGLAVRLMRVEKITPDEYAETEIELIDTGWHPEAIRTHTLNSSNGLEAIDGSRWVNR